jgi:hypothetical protein
MNGAPFQEAVQLITQNARIVGLSARQGELREFDLVLPQ